MGSVTISHRRRSDAATHAPPLTGMVVGVMISLVLWGIIAAVALAVA
jgi:tetrahydromethanopterin S-methyltransferase subunit F